MGNIPGIISTAGFIPMQINSKQGMSSLMVALTSDQVDPTVVPTSAGERDMLTLCSQTT